MDSWTACSADSHTARHRGTSNMPLLLDDDAGGPGGSTGGGFDLHSATTLFWKAVPVVLRSADREDTHTEQLTFRILSGFAKHNHSLRVREPRMVSPVPPVNGAGLPRTRLGAEASRVSCHRRFFACMFQMTTTCASCTRLRSARRTLPN